MLVVGRALVPVGHHQPDGGPQSEPVLGAAQNGDLIGLLPLGGQPALAGPAAVELALDVGGCERLVFVDAHVAAEPRAIVCVAVQPEARLSSTLSHTLPVEGFLWLVQAVAGRAPESFLVSLRGQCFEPGRGLSPAAAGLVEQAAAMAWRLTGARIAPPESMAKE